ncbi:polysaccharide deacetylase family protein [Bradyrhizobium prioriisuperbiae]|uniref:polysaccharide deacetylase family protein n=1 Tax=Bradyrhizobium prioriisuperbiae TaxID=2854389 RepID=UPI0028E1F739|nr:polysaccharide deacetylase family protein [Bradyrhizobium prioritasuperba]
MLLLRTALLALTALAASAAIAEAAECPRADALGTSRVLQVDPKAWPRVGTRSFPQTLPLADKEVVLTFDDGPNPPTTKKVLAALARECVQATFFLIGQSAAAHPGLVKAMAAAGHTIGHHTWSHPNLGQIPEAEALANINRGIAADEAALNGKPTETPSTPFFRFPYFESRPSLLDTLQARGIAVFGADLWASDWTEITPQQELNLATERLQSARKGIILFHDTKTRTAAMLPDFLRYLRTNGYRVVHIVPKQPNRDASVAQ